jgi:hypothetical protein
MENLTRYSPAILNNNGVAEASMVSTNVGEFVKFSDINELLQTSHNSQSTPLCACGQPAVKVLCDNCFCDEVFAATKKRA